MTKEDARYYLQSSGFSEEQINTIEQALSQECVGSTQKHVGNALEMRCDDAISRQAVLKELKESAEHHANDSREEALLRRDRDIIRALPPVNPQPKTGHWIDKDFRKEEYVLAGKCSVCGRVRVIDEFCSHCGADMESSDADN